MKTFASILIIIFLLGFSTATFADQKTELLLQRAVLQERGARLAAEFELNKRNLANVEAKLAELAKQEREKKEKEEKKPVDEVK